jgi:hypothetical protein
MAGSTLLAAVTDGGACVEPELEGIVVAPANAMGELFDWAVRAISAGAEPVAVLDAPAMLYWVCGPGWVRMRPVDVAGRVLEFISRMMWHLNGVKVVVSAWLPAASLFVSRGAGRRTATPGQEM